MTNYKTPYGAVAYLGPDALKESLDEVWLCCGHFPGYAMGALNQGAKKLLFNQNHPAYNKIENLAHKHGAKILPCQIDLPEWSSR